MSKKTSSRQCLNNINSLTAWDEAISDAEKMLREAEDRVRQLAEAVRIFKRRRANGEPFFGEREKPKL